MWKECQPFNYIRTFAPQSLFGAFNIKILLQHSFGVLRGAVLAIIYLSNQSLHGLVPAANAAARCPPQPFRSSNSS